MAQATDSAGNIGTSSTVTFSYCNRDTKAPPTVIITYPLNGTYGTNWIGEITGTASSNAGAGTTIKTTTLAIEDIATDKWWGGSSFNASSQSFVPVSGTTTWMLSFGAGLTSGVTYTLVAEATDSVGNIGTSSTVTFTYNTTPPLVTITYPVNNTTYGTNWGGAITGTASSQNLLSSVKVSVQQGSGSNSCWTGTGTTFTAACPNYLPVSAGTTNWSRNLAAAELTNGDSYSVIARATDSVENIGTSSTVAFTYSTTTPPPPPPPPPPPTTPPTVTVTYPVNGTTYGTDWTGTITGTASANSGSSLSEHSGSHRGHHHQ